MHNEISLKIRETIAKEDSIIAEHFYKLWLDTGVPENSIKPNHHSLTLEFIT
ncbi:putative acetyltransferase [Calothrix parasitica NIES-267]|uniref:Putative acetyltransferase n=1 Tax=Calothrix parasitica NIES-267 TaxID=1973488 RepID=A0A1Z4M189_9CYAN|nr:putative acetyltransferase [Calothrix parasitica NIES-267]